MGSVTLSFFAAATTAEASTSTRKIPPEDIDKNRFDVFVREQDAEGVFDLLLVGSSAYVEEVRRLASGVLR